MSNIRENLNTGDLELSIPLARVQTPSLILVLLCALGMFWAPSARSVDIAPTALTDQQLPALGNSVTGDRLLLREISDLHIYRAAAASSSPSRLAESVTAPDNARPASVWELVRDSQRLRIPRHSSVTRYRQKYGEEARWVSHIFQRATPYVGYIVAELDKRFLPLELALLPAIESGYQPDVHSSQQALGIWQIVPATATDIGLNKTIWFDGRSDIVASTRAAADYLSYLNAEFNGDWALTLAAYNAGLGRVRNALERNRKAGLPTDFWSLRLPAETREYVPKFLALVALLRYDRPNDFLIPIVSQGRFFDVLETPSRMSIDRVAELASLPEEQLRHLNAGLRKGITPPEGPHRIYVPQGYVAPLLERISGLDPNELHSTPEFHTVVAGDNLGALALRYNMSQKRLKQLNSLDSDLIRIGQRLRIFDMKSNNSRIDYVVTIGDTLWHIAQKHSVKVSNIRDEQGRQLASDVIHPGERLSLLID